MEEVQTQKNEQNKRNGRWDPPPHRKEADQIAWSFSKEFSIDNLVWPNLKQSFEHLVEKHFLGVIEGNEKLVTDMRDGIHEILLEQWLKLTLPECWDEDHLRNRLEWSWRGCDYASFLPDSEYTLLFEEAVDKYYHKLMFKIIDSLYVMPQCLEPDVLSSMIPDLKTNLFSKEFVMLRYMRSMQTLKDRGNNWKETYDNLLEIYRSNRPKTAKERLNLVAQGENIIENLL